MTGLFGGFGILFVVTFLLIAGAFVYAIGRGIQQWASNNAQPVLSAEARVVGRRTSTSGGGDTVVTTWYHVTFETTDGQRQEFGVDGRAYGLLAEGDRGTLTHQGTRYKGFVRVGMP